MATTYIGETIRDWRETNKLTRRQLAKELGVCIATVRNWETQGREPKLSYILAMEDFRRGLVKRLRTILRLLPESFKHVIRDHVKKTQGRKRKKMAAASVDAKPVLNGHAKRKQSGAAAQPAD